MKKVCLILFPILISYCGVSSAMSNLSDDLVNVIVKATVSSTLSDQKLRQCSVLMLVCKKWKLMAFQCVKDGFTYEKVKNLFEVVEKNLSVELFVQLIQAGADIHRQIGYFPNYPIISCWRSIIQKQDSKWLKCCIKNGAKVNAQDDDPEYVGFPREPGLHLAAKIGWYEGVKLLLEAGADTSIKHEGLLASQHTQDPEIKKLFDSYACLA